ncbi:protein OBERON 3-like isoform X1 [Juglans microcarpa x Juglans regia]|uniref:protein OBERON 3-like isoform X1 n=1 Tax=Juglans microcarpa x Juglans regia TaxID=2249226 RepID=UPI001B7EF7FE|nr:protein OBERON 3-like isoform X1 [Juglans microcarpa x Juglans regia]
MFGEKDLSNGAVSCERDNSSQGKFSRHISDRRKENPDEKMRFSEKGMGFLRESVTGSDGFRSKHPKAGTSGSQELTLSYLCDSSKLGLSEREIPAKSFLNTFEKVALKRREPDNSNQDEKWVERDFLNLNETRGNSSKQEIQDDVEGENIVDKKPKLDILNLSLALPDASHSISPLNPSQNADPPARSKPTRSMQSLAPSGNNQQTTCSNDFTAPSMSYSFSHPLSHNPSCSLTRNSTENYEYSVGREDQIWNCGEGTNGSVHSRFKPIGDGVVTLSNHGGGFFSTLQGNQSNRNKELCNNSHYMTTTSSDNHSFFPSELPARPRFDTQSGDSRGRGSEGLRNFEGVDRGGRVRKASKPERIIRDIISDPIPTMAQSIQELPDDTVALVKDYLKCIITMPEKKEELVGLQSCLERRSDFTKETLSKCHKLQLEILITVKMGLGSYLSSEIRLPIAELVEIFLYMRCRNVNCRSMLPVDDCDCKICSANKGFCSQCMCPICLNYDCANNTCSWVGCDVCSHWCHAVCGIQKNLIKPGPSLKGPSGTTEMQFHCIGCGHASEMFGFVKDVFLCCAKDWGLLTLKKELDCVCKIFRGSEDYKGKELHMKADEMLSKLESKLISPLDACNVIIQFFNYTGAMPDFPASGVVSKALVATQAILGKEATPLPHATSLPPMYTSYNTSSSSMRNDLLSIDLRQSDLKPSIVSELTTDVDFRFGPMPKKDGFDSLESLVRIKEAEARMFQSKADDAMREAEGFRRMIKTKTEKLEEEYAGKLGKLCLQETEDRRRKKLEELKVLENSHCDYYNMKMRMKADIDGLLKRMEATKEQWV